MFRNKSNDQTNTFHIAYVSTATVSLEHNELKAIERISQINNHKFGITGIFAYGNGKLMQYLEGSEFNVRRLMSVIAMDARHHSVDILRNEFIPMQQFINWHMRLTHLNEIQADKGIIHDKLFNIKINNMLNNEYAVETKTMLLAFKRSSLNM